MNLLEAYKGRLAVAEKVYSKSHNGERLTEAKKIVLARCLANQQKFLTEAFENSVGTQRSDMGMFKKFALNLTNVALPNLISYDLVIVQPLSSMSGYINYIEYVAGSNKGQTGAGDLFNNPFQLGKVDPNYTSSAVEESKNFASATTSIPFAWNPVVPGTVKLVAGSDTYYDDGNGKLYKATSVATKLVQDTEEVDGRLEGTAVRIVRTFDAAATEAGTVVYGNANTKGVRTPTDTRDGVEQIYDASTAGITLTNGITGAATLTYNYNNVAIPQNDLPMLTAQMKAIALTAKARRIAIYYSQMAAFQAKTDYGFNLEEQLAEKAVGQLQYEIDTEVVSLLDKTAGTPDAELTWNRNKPVGISLAEHYESFVEKIAVARDLIYRRTQRFAPNYMIVASDVLRYLGFAKGWVAAGTQNINGPYFAGTIDGLKVFVSPTLALGRFLIGVNGDDMMSSVAVYAPYMPIVPTQLLGFADGGMSQGWSTMYALAVLNKNLIVAGEVVAEDYNKYFGGAVASTKA